MTEEISIFDSATLFWEGKAPTEGPHFPKGHAFFHVRIIEYVSGLCDVVIIHGIAVVGPAGPMIESGGEKLAILTTPNGPVDMLDAIEIYNKCIEGKKSRGWRDSSRSIPIPESLNDVSSIIETEDTSEREPESTEEIWKQYIMVRSGE